MAGSKRARRASKELVVDDSTAGRLVRRLLDLGIDGFGPVHSARQVAATALAAEHDPERAARRVARRHLVTGGVGGFVTSLGGFVTMPVAMPANVAEFYLGATQMVAAIAALRGYDVDDPRVRTAVLLTLVGADADDVLKRVGVGKGSGKLTDIAMGGLPPAALMVVNKAIGFRLLRGIGEKGLSRLGRGVPLAGGVVGAGVDGFMMKKIADHALREFPRLCALSQIEGGPGDRSRTGS